MKRSNEVSTGRIIGVVIVSFLVVGLVASCSFGIGGLALMGAAQNIMDTGYLPQTTANGAIPQTTPGATQAPQQTPGTIGQPDTGEPVTKLLQAQGLNKYFLDLEFLPDARQLKGYMTFYFTNKEDVTLESLHFSVFANSFKDPDSAPFTAEDWDSAYPNGFSPGDIIIESVTVDTGLVEYALAGEQEQILIVDMPKEGVAPGGQAVVEIEYLITIPNCHGRFGYGDNTFSLVNCTPTLNIYEDGQWMDYTYDAMGDPFYAEVSDYSATIVTPADFIIAATGVLSQRTEDGRAEWTVNAPARRDFGFVASESFVIYQDEWEDVTVRSYVLDDGESTAYGDASLRAAIEALETFTAHYGEYPYGELSVVQTDFYIGGMEYPGMVLIDSSLYNRTYGDIMEIIVVHEVAHQWFYAVVGNNQITVPWLDEAFAEFSTNLFYETHGGAGHESYLRSTEIYYASICSGTQGQYRVDTPAPDFGEAIYYSAWVYARGAAVLSDIRAIMGDESFFAAMQEYYEANRLGIAGRQDFLDVIERHRGEDISKWLEIQFGMAE